MLRGNDAAWPGSDGPVDLELQRNQQPAGRLGVLGLHRQWHGHRDGQSSSGQCRRLGAVRWAGKDSIRLTIPWGPAGAISAGASESCKIQVVVPSSSPIPTAPDAPCSTWGGSQPQREDTTAGAKATKLREAARPEPTLFTRKTNSTLTRTIRQAAAPGPQSLQPRPALVSRRSSRLVTHRSRSILSQRPTARSAVFC